MRGINPRSITRCQLKPLPQPVVIHRNGRRRFYGKTCVDCQKGGRLCVRWLISHRLYPAAVFLGAVRSESKSQTGILAFFYQVRAMLLEDTELGFLSWSLGKFPDDSGSSSLRVRMSTPLGQVGLSFLGPMSHFGFAAIFSLVLFLLRNKLKKRSYHFRHAACSTAENIPCGFVPSLCRHSCFFC